MLTGQSLVKGLAWVLFFPFYRIRLIGRQNIPRTGGALIVSNHVSWLDGFLVILTCPRPIRMMVWEGNFQLPLVNWAAKKWGAILINPRRPKELVKALRTARKALQNGELVGIFPEGGISRTGVLQDFKPGVLRVLDGTDVPVVPMYLDELWGSLFSFEGGKFFWKWPKKWRYPISIHFGKPVQDARTTHQIRVAVQALGSQAVTRRSQAMKQVTRSFIKVCKRRKFASKVSDSTGMNVKGGELLTRTLALRRILRRHVLKADEKYVGVLLPPSVVGVAANAAISVDSRVPVNLNYTVSNEILNECIQQAGIQHVITSRKFLEKFPFEMDAEVVCLEDLKEKATSTDRILSAIQAFAIPSSILERSLKLHQAQADDVVTIIFTSGSTGVPKGVMLTFANVGSNIEAIQQVVQLSKTDTLIGILPFFHSFGFTVTLWAALALDVKGAYHFSPLDAKQVGKLCKKNSGTILLSTPTFLRSYLRRVDPDEFASLDVVVTGAERLPPQLADAFEKRFGVRPVEGYGTTELSPLASVNVPESRQLSTEQPSNKPGSVGRPVPGVCAKTVNLESGEECDVDEPGMLLIRGPNVMKGYLNQPELTNDVIKDGWYVTGDVARIDADGFIVITGRESRFSKIGGEMVPHIEIEEKLNECVSDDDDDQLRIAVTAIPDERKGEKLIVFHLPMEHSPEDCRQYLSDSGLPNIYIPSADSFCDIDEMPILGTGKLDLKALKALALEKFGD